MRNIEYQVIKFNYITNHIINILFNHLLQVQLVTCDRNHLQQGFGAKSRFRINLDYIVEHALSFKHVNWSQRLLKYDLMLKQGIKGELDK